MVIHIRLPSADSVRRTADVTALGGSPEGIAGFVMTQAATAADAVKAPATGDIDSLRSRHHVE